MVVSKRGMKSLNSYWLGNFACATANGRALSCADFGSSCTLILIQVEPFPSRPASWAEYSLRLSRSLGDVRLIIEHLTLNCIKRWTLRSSLEALWWLMNHHWGGHESGLLHSRIPESCLKGHSMINRTEGFLTETAAAKALQIAL